MSKKIVAVGVSAATMLWLSGAAMLVPVAGAATEAELQAQIDALLAQITSLQAQMSGGASATYTRDLTLGSTGDDVSSLQTYLVAQNKGPKAAALAAVFAAGTAKGYFGSMTQAALAEYQAAAGISPAAGYFGPITRAHLAAAAPAPEEGEEDGDLEGGAGAVDQYDLVSGLENEEVGEDAEDVSVAGLEMEVSDSSDLEFTAVTLDFDQGTANNDDFADYASEVSIWLSASPEEEVARVDADKFDEDTAWRRTVTLDDGAIVQAGETGELIVKVSGASAIDGNDVGETWTVDFDQVRFRDATGASTSEDPATAARTMSFESFATAADLELQVSLDEEDDDINEAHVVDIDDTDDTDNVEFLSITIEIEGDSDVTIDEIPVEINTVEAAGANFNDPDDVVVAASLWMEASPAEEIATENLSAADADDDTEVVTFDDLDVELAGGSTTKFFVKLDLVSTADALDNADTIEVEMDAGEVDLIDAEDDSGEQLVAADLTGTADADAHVVYDTGVQADFVSASQTRSFTADAATEEDTGEYKIVFKVTSFDGDESIDRSCEEGGADAAGQGVEFTVTNTAENASTCVLTSTTSDTEDTANTFEVDEDTTRTFTLTVNVTDNDDADTGNYAEVAFESINWGAADDDTNANYYTFGLNEFKTDSLFLAEL